MLSQNDKSLLVNIYYEGSIVQKKSPPKRLEHLVKWTKQINHVRRSHYLLELTPLGREFAEMYLRMLGRRAGHKRGIAFEEKSWKEIQPIDFSSEEVCEAFKFLCELGEIRYEIMEDLWPKRKRVITNELAMGLARISYEIKWESQGRNPAILKWEQHVNWLWLYLDSVLELLINQPFQQEFVVWDDF